MSMKYTKKDINPASLITDLARNERFTSSIPVYGVKVDTYDLPSMIYQIVEARGVIRKPIIADGQLSVLQGFRRTLASQEILRNPEKYVPNADVRAEILGNLSKVPVLVYGDLTEAERDTLISDHGDRRPIARAELVNAIWNFYNQGHNEFDCGRQFWFNLARYTGNEKKLNTLPEPGTEAFNAAIKKWFHGTLGNHILAAYNMGPRVREALMITEMITDGLIKFDEAKNQYTKVPEFFAKRSRVQALGTAKEKDIKSGNWDGEHFTGPEFDKKLNEFIEEDKNPDAVSASKDERMKAADLKQRSDNAYSKLAKAVFKVAAGTPATELPSLDMLSARAEQVFGLIDKYLDKIGNPLIKDVLGRVLEAKVSDFEQFLLEESKVATEPGSPEPVSEPTYDQTVEQQQN